MYGEDLRTKLSGCLGYVPDEFEFKDPFASDSDGSVNFGYKDLPPGKKEEVITSEMSLYPT